MSSGRSRRTGAGPPCRCTWEKNRSDGLQHRCLGADRLDHAVGAQPAGELLDPGHPGVAALGDDVGRAEGDHELLAGLVAAHGDDPLGPELAGGQQARDQVVGGDLGVATRGVVGQGDAQGLGLGAAGADGCLWRQALW
jgi:hypothetical protein